MVATNDIGAEVAKLLTGPAWSGHRVIELGSMVGADEVAEQLGEVLKRDVKAFAVPRAGWSEAFEQFGVPKGHTGPAEEMFESVTRDDGPRNHGTEHVADTRPHACTAAATDGQDERPFRLNGWDAVVSSLGTGLSPFREVSLLTVATGALVTAIPQRRTPLGLHQRLGGRGQPAVARGGGFPWSCGVRGNTRSGAQGGLKRSGDGSLFDMTD